MRRLFFPLRHILKRAGNVLIRYGRPVFKAEVVGRGLTFWGRIILRPIAVSAYQKRWRHDRSLGNSHRPKTAFKYLSNRAIADRIKELFLTSTRYNQSLMEHGVPNRIDEYEIGSNIACGCSAAVYEARALQWERSHALHGTYASFPCTSNLAEKYTEPSKDPVRLYPLALKIMFNYQYDTPERILWQEMGNELVPLVGAQERLKGRMAGITILPRSHPNIVKMYRAFTDRMPLLKDARSLYPEALPPTDYQELIIDEFRTLFIVMKRYRMTLREYVLTRKRNYWVGRVMYGQLLEALVYLYDHQISHRDMKSDNILLDFDDDDDVPHLVLSDFGCALTKGSWLVHYNNDSVDLGGNLALRAPEVARAKPGTGVCIDFRMADVWAAATIAYEIFTRRNPFYSQLKSADYTEYELPPLPTRLHYAVKGMITDSLQVDAKKRPKPHVAANVLCISLFRFGKDLRKFFSGCGFANLLFGNKIRDFGSKSGKFFSVLSERMNAAVDDLTMLYATETLLVRNLEPKVVSDAELQLRATFLTRLDREQIWSAIDYFYFDD